MYILPSASQAEPYSTIPLPYFCVTTRNGTDSYLAKDDVATLPSPTFALAIGFCVITLRDARNASVSISLPSGPVNLPALKEEKPSISKITFLTVPSKPLLKYVFKLAPPKGLIPAGVNITGIASPTLIVTLPLELSYKKSL